MQAWRPFKTWEAESTAPWIISIVPGLAQVDTWIFWETPLSLTAPVSGRPPQLLLNAQVLLVPHSPLCSKTANWQLRTIYFHSTPHSRSPESGGELREKNPELSFHTEHCGRKGAFPVQAGLDEERSSWLRSLEQGRRENSHVPTSYLEAHGVLLGTLCKYVWISTKIPPRGWWGGHSNPLLPPGLS